jgi:hypothetical protein
VGYANTSPSGITAFLKDSQAFFMEQVRLDRSLDNAISEDFYLLTMSQRLVWAMIIIAIGTMPTHHCYIT